MGDRARTRILSFIHSHFFQHIVVSRSFAHYFFSGPANFFLLLFSFSRLGRAMCGNLNEILLHFKNELRTSVFFLEPVINFSRLCIPPLSSRYICYVYVQYFAISFWRNAISKKLLIFEVAKFILPIYWDPNEFRHVTSICLE